MSVAEIRLAVYEDRPGRGFDCGNEKALYEIADGLRAELTEARTKLGIAEKAIDDLRTLLVERDEQIAGLLAEEVDLSDDQPGAPA